MLVHKLMGANGAIVPPEYIAHQYSDSASATNSFSASIPTGSAAGELLLWFGGSSANATNITYTFPSGWTEIADQNAPGNLHVGYKISNGSEPSTATIMANSSASIIAACIIRFSAGVIDTQSAIQRTTSSSDVVPAITVSENTSTLLLLAYNNSLDDTFTASGMTEDINTGTTSNFSFGVFSESVDAGDTGTRTVICSTTRTMSSMLLALGPS